MGNSSKTFRSNLRKEIDRERKERDKQINDVKKLPLLPETKKNVIWEIGKNFQMKMSQLKERPWYAESEKIHKSERELKRAEMEYEKFLLEESRNEWEKNINISDEAKEKIIGALKKINVDVEKDTNWNRTIKLLIWDKKYKIIDSSTEKAPLKDWVKVISEDRFNEILQDLWKIADLNDKSDRLAMFMYLTGMKWKYLMRTKYDNPVDNPFYNQNFPMDYDIVLNLSYKWNKTEQRWMFSKCPKRVLLMAV